MDGEPPGGEVALASAQVCPDDPVAIDDFVLDPDCRAHGADGAHGESGVVVASAACSAAIDASNAAVLPLAALMAAALRVEALARSELCNDDEPDGGGDPGGLTLATAARSTSTCAACRCRGAASRPAATASTDAIARS
jgi:hypothetical protein